MEHTPPPFFNRGPAPLVRLAFFASLSLALLVLDARFRYTESLRSVIALAVYPLQVIASLPAGLGERISAYFVSQAQLREENTELRAKLLDASQRAQRYEAARAENGQLRRLIGAGERLALKSQPAEILYSGRDPYSRKVVIDKGGQNGLRAGSPDAPHPMQSAFVRHDGYQCGYCTSGQICSAVATLSEIAAGVPSHVSADLVARPRVTAHELRERMSGNICRCGAYSNIQDAIAEVAGVAS
jgi:hypothetical protein